MTQATPTLPQPVTLSDYFKIDPERFHRTMVVRQPGLQVLHLSLAPGQSLPLHNHPGYHVVLQALQGTLTVQLEDHESTLEPGQLLHFAGELHVSPRNNQPTPAAMLITLAKNPDSQP
ncbi:MAG TPA: cupin domain-containing protein [Trueperaceae bacterium]